MHLRNNNENKKKSLIDIEVFKRVALKMPMNGLRVMEFKMGPWTCLVQTRVMAPARLFPKRSAIIIAPTTKIELISQITAP